MQNKTFSCYFRVWRSFYPLCFVNTKIPGHAHTSNIQKKKKIIQKIFHQFDTNGLLCDEKVALPGTHHAHIHTTNRLHIYTQVERSSLLQHL